jgi:hypothetical protein
LYFYMWEWMKGSCLVQMKLGVYKWQTSCFIRD